MSEKKAAEKKRSTKTNVPGVRKTASGKFVAKVTKFLGSFDTISEAKKMRDEIAKKLDALMPKKAAA